MQSRRLIIPLVAVLLLSGVVFWLYFQDSPSEMDGDSIKYEILAEGLDVPWSLAISRDDGVFFTERNGNVKMLVDGEAHTIYTLDVSSRDGAESGLLGIALNPGFPQDPRVYIYYTYLDAEGTPWNRVSWLTYSNASLINETVLVDHIPAGNFHDRGRIKFGPDGKLYVATGEKGDGKIAQDINSLGGKILRYNPDGSIPVDNPFRDSPVYSYGHRNPQGLAWHPETGELYSTEHGPSGESLRFAHDEINLIKPGNNYGWPEVIGNSDNPNYTDPVFHTGDDTWAPSGATFLDDPDSVWHGSLFIANLRGTSIRVISFSPPDYTRVETNIPLFEDFGRIRTVVQGPNGYLYFCTSNRDGRGRPRERDDVIVRFSP